MTTLYDLSRLLDRVNAIDDELGDLAVSKVGDRVDDEIAAAATAAMSGVELLKSTIEDLLGDPRNYREAARCA